MLLKLFFPLIFFVIVEGGFFDLTDVEDPLALLWNLHPEKKIQECKGVCIEKSKCILTGGTPKGHCGLFFTCCSYEESCVKSSDLKQSYFEVRDLRSDVTTCKYTIKLRNKNVCQIRLDFDRFVLAPATLTASKTSTGSVDLFTCSNDFLRITPDNYGVPVLCGYNSQQHLYIHVNQDTDRAVTLDIKLADRLQNKDLTKPTWKIQFTQLECPVKKNKFDIMKYKDVDDIANDFNALAPQGAIQYFTESTGEIRSFGFEKAEAATEDQMTSYPYGEHYTIAFRRPPTTCGIKFTTVTLNLFRSTGQSSSCYDYLFIPEFFAPKVQELGPDKTLCSAEINDAFYSYAPGPFYINFKSKTTDKVTSKSKENQGFQLNYELLNNKFCP